MSVMNEVDPSHGDFNPEEAHREGAFSYHLWTASAVVLRQIGLIEKPLPEIKAYDGDYRHLLLACRAVVVLSDLFCVLLVWSIARHITGQESAGLIAAAILAITPYEVIHAHFMRTHNMANAAAMLAVWLALRLRHDQRWTAFAICGVATGVAAATRYTAVTVGVVPALIAIGARLEHRNGRTLFESVDLPSLTPKFVVLSLSTIAGFAAADPFLFLDFRSASSYLGVTATYAVTDQFSLASFLDLSKLWLYIVWLIPYGMLPLLWILIYASFIYVLFLRRYWVYVLPLWIFSVAYLYPMAKGYLAVPGFIRAALLVFPVFAVFCGIACTSVWTSLRPHRLTRGCLAMFAAFIWCASLAYDVAYLRGMNHDPRVKLHQALEAEVAKRGPIRVTVDEGPWNYFILDPAFAGLPPNLVHVNTASDALADSNTSDFAVLWAFEYTNYPNAEARIRNAEASGQWSAAIDLRTPVSIAGIPFSYERNPHDLVYPYPALYLVRSNRVKSEPFGPTTNGGDPESSKTPNQKTD